MGITITYKGDRESQLINLNKLRNNHSKPMRVRKDANKAFGKILSQLEDKKLMSLRSQLAGAARAGDDYIMAKITAQIKDHMGEDRETGHYGI